MHLDLLNKLKKKSRDTFVARLHTLTHFTSQAGCKCGNHKMISRWLIFFNLVGGKKRNINPLSISLLLLSTLSKYISHLLFHTVTATAGMTEMHTTPITSMIYVFGNESAEKESKHRSSDNAWEYFAYFDSVSQCKRIRFLGNETVSLHAKPEGRVIHITKALLGTSQQANFCNNHLMLLLCKQVFYHV